MVEEIYTLLLAMTPIVGIRGALPLALTFFEMSLPMAYFLSVAGEFFPVIFIILFLGVVSDWLSENFSFMKKFFEVLFQKTRKDYGKKIEKYGPIALFFIAAIPVPFSGAWTTSLLVFLFGLPFYKSVIAIFLGILVAGINIILIMQTGIAIEKYYGLATLITVLIVAIVVYFIYYRRKEKIKN